MIREYFISAPLLKAPRPLECGQCLIRLRGHGGYSLVEGPSKEAIDDALDSFAYGICGMGNRSLRGMRVVLRSGAEPAVLPDDPEEVESVQWTAWAFSKLPLHRIPLVALKERQCQAIERLVAEGTDT